MDLGIKGRKALVAGSSSGIGFECARLFAEEGVDLLLVARSSDRLGAAARSLGGGRVEFVAADLSTAEGVETVARAASGFGGIDILVNNAGGPKAGPFDALTDDDWLSAFNLNLMSAVRLTRRCLPHMIERRWGRIVNIMSTSVKQPVDNLMLSNSVRMAVVGFSKTLTTEVSHHGITINTVGPGFAATDRLSSLARTTAERQGITEEQVREKWASDVPLRRIGKPEEVAAAVVFLASEQAAYINGTFLPVDGGRIKASL